MNTPQILQRTASTIPKYSQLLEKDSKTGVDNVNNVTSATSWLVKKFCEKKQNLFHDKVYIAYLFFSFQFKD